MSGSCRSVLSSVSEGEPAGGLRRGAALALVFAGVLATGAATGAWSSGFEARAGAAPTRGEGRSTAPPSPAAPVHGTPGGGSAAVRGPERTGRADAETLVSRSGDRWSASYTAGEYEGLRRTLDGEYVGVGIAVHREHGAGSPAVRVARVTPSSPAARAGVRPGDRLRAVDGVRVAERPVTEVVARLRGAAGKPHDRDGAAPRARAPRPGSRVALELGRSGRRWNTTLHRAVLHTDPVRVSRAHGAARITVSAFTKGSGSRLREAVRALPRGEGVLLDLRGNSGGLVAEAGRAASAFLDGGLVATYDDRGHQRVVHAEAGGDTRRPLVVLVDGGTMSAAELLAGALQDRGRAVVVGSRTFGKGTVQLPRKLPDGSVAELTAGRYATPSGRRIDGEGITPDLDVRSAEGTEDRGRTVLSGLATGV